jgi:hypothetical protein
MSPGPGIQPYPGVTPSTRSNFAVSSPIFESFIGAKSTSTAARAGVGFTGGHFHKNWLDDNFRKVVLNAAVWICKAEVPKDGVGSRVAEEEIKENLDPKPKRKR